MSISLKEAGETEYWIELLLKSDIVDEQEVGALLKSCVEVKKILHGIVKTSKKTIN